MKIYKRKWYNTCWNSINSGAIQADANGNFLAFNTKKQAREYSEKTNGKEYTNYCVITCKGAEL